MDWKKLHDLGVSDGKEHYLDLRPTMDDDKGKPAPNPNYKQVVWRIPDIREAIVAEPGYMILSADYSQIEVKLMAHLSRDPVLIAAINSGKDIHSYNATEVFGSINHFDYETMSAAKGDKSHPRHVELVKLRNDIKTVTFGVPYGAGPNKVALMTGMEVDDATAFIEAFFAKFSVLGAWLKKTGEFAITHGYSQSPRGRRRFYELPSPDTKEKEKDKLFSQFKRYAGNHPIQAGNVDMLKPAMFEIYHDLRTQGYTAKGCRILFCVHDEVVMTAPTELAMRTDEAGASIPVELFDKYKKEKKKLTAGPVESIMQNRMQESYDYIIPDIVNKIDVAIGPVWEKA